MQIGPYALGETMVPNTSTKELSFLGYLTLRKTFKGEKIYRVPDVVFLGYPWNMMVATIGQRIYKLSAQFDSSLGGRLRVEKHIASAAADAVYGDSCRLCDEQFGARTGTALGAGAEWNTPFGNIVVDRKAAFGRFYVNFQCTDSSVVNARRST